MRTNASYTQREIGTTDSRNIKLRYNVALTRAGLGHKPSLYSVTNHNPEGNCPTERMDYAHGTRKANGG
jgi:hypothetical protein